MAKKSTDEYLAGILKSLDDIIKENKNTSKPQGQSNVPNSAIFTADATSIKTIGDSLKVLSSAIIPIAKISDEDLNKVAKTINSIAGAFQSITVDKEHMIALRLMIGVFNEMSKVIDKMSENFFKSFFKFGPARAHLIGRRMSRFYKIILKYLVSALKEVMNPLGEIGDTKGIKEKIEAMSSLAKLMVFDVKPADLKKIIEMSVVLTEKRGRRIARFYTALIEELAKVDPDGKTTGRAIDLVKSITKLIGIMTISLIAIVALTIIAPPEKVTIGLGLLAIMIGGTYLLMKGLASDKFKKVSKGMGQALMGIALLIGALTLSLIALTFIATNFEREQILGGLGLLVVVAGIATGLMWILSRNSIQKSSKQSLITVGGIILLFVGISAAMFITMQIGKSAKDVLEGGILVTAFSLVGIWLIKKFAKIPRNVLIKGLIGVAGVALMIAGISAAMLVYGEFMKQVHDITLGDITASVALTAGMIVGMIGLAHILSPLAIDPFFWAGFGMVETISVMIASISGAMLLFTNLVKEIKALSEEDIKNALKRITEKDGMVDCLRTIIDKLDDFGIKSALKVAAIGVSIRPVITAISQFVDVIQKMATMSIADEWDKDGKPTHYLKMQPEDFSAAADSLSKAFATFLKRLSIGLKGFDADSAMIIKLLFPGQRRSGREKPGIGTVINTLSDFVDVIWKMASLSVPDAWDKDGKPISYRQLTNTEFKEGAIALSQAFGSFVSELGKGLEDVNIKSMVALKILSGPLGELLPSIAAIMNPIMQVAVGKLVVGDQVLDLKFENMKKAGSDIVKIIESLINPLSTLSANDIDHDDIRNIADSFVYIIDSLGKVSDSFVFKKEFIQQAAWAITGFVQFSNFLTNPERDFGVIKTNSGKFEGAMKNFTKGIEHIFKIKEVNENFVNHSKNLVSGIAKITNYLQSTLYFTKAEKNSEAFKRIMSNTKTGIQSITPFLKSTPAQLRDIAKAIKELDVELIDKEEKRTEAMQSISSNFKDMSENIGKLNSTLNDSLKLMNRYNTLRFLAGNNMQIKGANAIVDATERVKNTVESAYERTKSKEENKNEQMKILGQYISNAIIDAMNNWTNQNKELTVKFDESPKALFGNLEIG